MEKNKIKKLLLILFCLAMVGFGQNVNIPDANFKAYLVGNTAINTNGDAEIQVSEAAIGKAMIKVVNTEFKNKHLESNDINLLALHLINVK